MDFYPVSLGHTFCRLRSLKANGVRQKRTDEVTQMSVRLKILCSSLGVISFLLIPASNEAATRTASSCSSSAVQTAINSSSSGDTVLVPAGNCTWSSTVVIPAGKDITLLGAGIDSTTITSSAGGTALKIEFGSSRVSGFTFNCGNINLDGEGWRIDHNKFTCSSFQEGVWVSGTRNTDSPKGLVDHNTFINQRVLVYGYPAVGNEILGATQWLDPLALGTDEAVYVEDNSFTFNVFGNATDCNYYGRYVFRHNTLTDVYLEAHSLQGHHRSCRKWEIYDNTLRQLNRAMYFPMFIRGGTGVVFNNGMTGSWGSAPNLVIDNVRSFEPRDDLGMCDGTSPWDGNTSGQSGWPCRDQIGRGADTSLMTGNNPYPSQSSEPAYFWNNTFNGVTGGVQVDNGAGIHLKKDRDYYVNSGPKPGYAPFVYPHPLQTGNSSSAPFRPSALRILP